MRRPVSDSKPNSAGKTWIPVRDKPGRNGFPTRQSSLHGDPEMPIRCPSSSGRTSKATVSRDEHLVKPSSPHKDQHNLTIETHNSDSDGWDSWDSPPAKELSPRSSTANYKADPLAPPSPCASLR